MMIYVQYIYIFFATYITYGGYELCMGLELIWGGGGHPMDQNRGFFFFLKENNN